MEYRVDAPAVRARAMSADLSASARAALDARYEVLRELGRGGTAVVYLARERATGTEVAIKLIRSKFIDDEEALARFAREARLVEQLQHPNIVPIRAVLDLDNSGRRDRDGASRRPNAPTGAQPRRIPSRRRAPSGSCATSARRSRLRTRWASFIATSSRRTSSSRTKDAPCSPTSAWRGR